MIETILKSALKYALLQHASTDIVETSIMLQKTRKDVLGDFSFNVFPFVKNSGKSPETLANLLGEELMKLNEVSKFEVVKGFLNLVIEEQYWIDLLNNQVHNPTYGFSEPNTKETVLIEYSSPNTNKPLHLGHIRNNLLGYSIAEIVKANGNKVVKVNLVNDRGIHICKSMLAWERWGNGETPESSGLKGDHLVGKYYVAFDKAYKAEIKQLVENGTLEENADAQSELMQDARQMLRDWEDGDAYTTKLWLKMNEWVCSGFDVTYNRLGVDFDKVYYESDTYLLGKEIVKKGLENGVLFQEEDGSIWIDLEAEGLDKKLLLRSDGTSVYMTQDLGTAELRIRDFDASEMLYVVGNEQNYHFDVLKLVLKKLGYSWADGLTHISYGMVELPNGKMKSREGTVVDADDLLDEMINTAKETTLALGKISEFTDLEAETLYANIGLGALKYFILKVDPKKKMMFNPEDSIDFNGNTGPFIQYTHARIRSVLNKAGNLPKMQLSGFDINEKEKDLLKNISQYPEVIKNAGANYSPALVANYIYELAREYNQFYHECPILKEEDALKVAFRLNLSAFTANVIKSGMLLLGIQVPNRM